MSVGGGLNLSESNEINCKLIYGLTSVLREARPIYTVNHAEVAAIFGQPYFQLLGGCVFCSHSPKRAIVEARGYAIDIWVDDMPEGIGARDAAEFKAFEAKFPVCETLPIFNNADISPTALWEPNAPLFSKTPKITVN